MDYKEFVEFLKEYVTDKFPTPILFERSLNKLYPKYTLKEIARAIYYFYIIQGNNITNFQKYGFSIVPFIVDEANGYFDKLKENQEQQTKAVESAATVQTVIIKPIGRRSRKKEVDISGL